MAGFGLVLVGGAAGVGINLLVLLVPLAVLPLVLTTLLFLRGGRPVVLFGSAAAALVYVALGTWNYFRAAAFEAANPGSMEVTGGAVSIVFVLLSLGTALWSFVAAILSMRRASG